jgi:hypothetical protein
MKKTDDFTLTGPCGIYCGECEAHKAKDDPALMEYMKSSKVLKTELLPCPGCRTVKGKCLAVDGTCETYACANEHAVDFCFECKEFPCAKLNPAADRAERLPHNIKLFSLCCIQHQGLARFVELYPEIKQRYFRGKMAIGKGPQL